MKKILLMCTLLLITITGLFAQRTISGKVVDTDGLALIGANVAVVGQDDIGTITDFDGMYELEVPADATELEFSYIGYTASIVPIDGNTIDVVLSEGITLNTAVVTALGITKEEKAIGYSAQTVDGDAVNQVAESNIVNSLAGKVSGIQVISASGAALGGSSKVRLRGVSGLTGGDPLYVVDGVPIQNDNFSGSFSSYGTSQGSTSGPDLGNLASDINPSDIESISVLKGASAAALYGNRARYGVVMITTKKGAAKKGLGVELNTMVSLDEVYILPSYQDEYAGGYTQDFIEFTDPKDGQVYNTLDYGADESWGPKMDGTQYRPWWSWLEDENYGKTIPLSPNPDNIRDYYETGITNQNNISFGKNLDEANFRVSFTNFNQKGVLPNSEFLRNTVYLGGGIDVSDNFRVDASVNVVSSDGLGRPSFGYSPLYGNPTQSFNQWFQRQLDMEKLEDYKNADGTFKSWNMKSPVDPTPKYWDSPYFTAYENAPTDSRQRYYGNIGLTYKITDNFSVKGTVGRDDYTQRAEYRVAPGGLEEEFYGERVVNGREDNYELRGTYDAEFSNIGLTVNVGGNARKNDFHLNTITSSGGLNAPVFNPELSTSRPGLDRIISERAVNSLFASVDLSFNRLVYITLTGRNDWSSTLPEDNNSYFYPSASLSFAFSELIENDILSFGKLRASYAVVGSDLDPYRLFAAYNINSARGAGSVFSVDNVLLNSELKPAFTNSLEVGFDLKFLRDRLGLDFTYFNNKSIDDILPLKVSGASGFESALVNAGEIVGSGIEIGLSATPVETRTFDWDTRINLAFNNTEVIELSDGINNYLLAEGIGGQRWGGLTLNAEKGKQWGLLKGNAVKQIDGKDVLSFNGTDFSYVTEADQELGSILPDFIGGFTNNFNIMGVEIGAHIDFQKGGRFFSVTKMFNNYSGLGSETVGNNDKGNPIRDPLLNSDGTAAEGTAINANDASENTGGIRIDGVDSEGNDLSVYVDPSSYYPGLFGLHEKHTYDASFIKLREVTIGYNLPTNWFDGTFIGGMKLSVIAKNPWLIYSAVDGIDPSEILPGSNNLVFEERGQLPSTRSIGLKLNVKL